ncbi:hypothetical protein [Zobellella maritima]|uniref:hypothetical protein n=1 Tax=Zobellella maritima TaxID=2059725 RepID=UPI000E3072E6|nr:hypothetical protein [Zobellella maritima]
MGTLIKWILILGILFMALSEVDMNTSLYKYEENQVEITFPSWQAEQPWIHIKWNPGKDEWLYQWRPEN